MTQRQRRKLIKATKGERPIFIDIYLEQIGEPRLTDKEANYLCKHQADIWREAKKPG